jgi:hypothetical protein
MGWFWAPVSAKTDTTPPTSISRAAYTAPSPVLPSAEPPTEFDDLDQRAVQFFMMLEADTKLASETSSHRGSALQQGVPPPTTQTHPTSAARLPNGRERSPSSLAMSEYSLPTTMSCRDAFDYAMHCNQFGSQWNSIYREGGMRRCGPLWEDFWFCMRTRSWSSEARAAAIKKHYRAKERAKYGADPTTGRLRPSSEDVWDSRDEPVKPGSVFSQDFPRPDVGDAEYIARELQYRRAVRERLEAQQTTAER